MATNATTEGAIGEPAGFTAGSVLSGFRSRIADRRKWPRRWWWPDEAPPETEDAAGTYQQLHDEVSRTIRRVMLTIVGYSFFCLLTLSTPDSIVVANNNKIRVPFAQIEVEFFDFLVIGPLVLLALVAYMHIFIAFWAQIPRRYVSRPLPYMFNMPGVISRCLAACLFYWLAPLLLFLFALKALPHFTGPNAFVAKALLLLASLSMATMLWVQIRCYPPKDRRRVRYLLRWVTLFLFACLSIKLALPLGDRAATATAAVARSAAEPILAELGLAPEDPIRVASSEPPGASTSASRDRPRAAVPSPSPGASDRTDRAGSSEPATEVSRNELAQRVVQQTLAQQTQSAAPILNRGLNLAGANLIDVDLSMRSYRNADLRSANLSGKEIEGTTDGWIDFYGANLSGAKLRGTRLVRVNFAAASLQNANLTQASIETVMFYRADLRGADMTGVDLGQNVDVQQADLRGLIGIDCLLLRQMKNFETAWRDPALACGKPIPETVPSSR